MIAAMLLREAFDAGVALAPGCGHDIAATIGGGFFEAGRFGGYKLAEGGEHLRQTGLQMAQEVFREIRLWHGGDMLPMLVVASNPSFLLLLAYFSKISSTALAQNSGAPPEFS